MDQAIPAMKSILLTLLASAVVAGPGGAYEGERIAYRESFDGELTYPTTPEINEISGSGLVGDEMPGTGPGPILTGSAARASASASGPSSQGVLLPGNSFGPGPMRVRGEFSSWSTPAETAAMALIDAEFEATGGTSLVSASVELESDVSGTLDWGTLVIQQNPALGAPSSGFVLLSPTELNAIDAGAAFTIDLVVDRDAAVASATLEIESLPPHAIGPLAIDATMAGLDLQLLVQALSHSAGADPAPTQVDLDGLEIRRLFTSSFTVDTQNDEVDLTPGDGSCLTANGLCSLRAAIQESNAIAGPGQISVPSGFQLLSIAGADEDAAATGDLDILDDLVLQGAGRDVTVVDAAGLDRVFHIPGSATPPRVQLMDLEITHGAALTAAGNAGGGIDSYGELDLMRCIVSHNLANLAGGIMNRYLLGIDDCIVRHNEAQALGFGNGKAGGIASGSSSAGGSASTSAWIRNSAIVENTGAIVGGIELGNAASAYLENTTISGNTNDQVNIWSTDVVLHHVTIASDSGRGINAGSYSGTDTLEIVNSAIHGVPACSLSTGAPIMTLFAGRNASSDTSCGFTGPGDVEGVALALGPLSLIDDTLAHWPLAGSPVIDGADASECLTDDQRGAARPIDGDESGTPECDLGAIEVPEPGLSTLISSGMLGLCVLAAKRRRGSR